MDFSILFSPDLAHRQETNRVQLHPGLYGSLPADLHQSSPLEIKLHLQCTIKQVHFQLESLLLQTNASSAFKDQI